MDWCTAKGVLCEQSSDRRALSDSFDLSRMPLCVSKSRALLSKSSVELGERPALLSRNAMLY